MALPMPLLAPVTMATLPCKPSSMALCFLLDAYAACFNAAAAVCHPTVPLAWPRSCPITLLLLHRDGASQAIRPDAGRLPGSRHPSPWRVGRRKWLARIALAVRRACRVARGLQPVAARVPGAPGIPWEPEQPGAALLPAAACRVALRGERVLPHNRPPPVASPGVVLQVRQRGLAVAHSPTPVAAFPHAAGRRAWPFHGSWLPATRTSQRTCSPPLRLWTGRGCSCWCASGSLVRCSNMAM